ncbi:MAG: hypothetical protein ACKO36_01120 [Actinomycetota bacterium]
MKTTKFNNLRKAALATVATAALVAGTAACGGKNDTATEVSADDIVAALLTAAQNGDNGAIDEILANTDPAVIAEVAPELAGLVDSPVAPIVDTAPAAQDAPAEDVASAPAAEEAPVVEDEPEIEEAPAAEAPAADAPAEEAPAAEAPAEEAPESGTSTGPSITLPGGGSFAGALPNYALVPTPEILIYTFQNSGTKINARVLVNAKGSGVLAEIDSVKISYLSRNSMGLFFPMTKTGTKLSTAGTGSTWAIDGMSVSEGATVTITATNKGGRTVSVAATVRVITF